MSNVKIADERQTRLIGSIIKRLELGKNTPGVQIEMAYKEAKKLRSLIWPAAFGKKNAMKQTGHHADEPIENYIDYKNKAFAKMEEATDAFLNSIATGSLRTEDKKLLLCNILCKVQTDILTKF